MLENIPVNTSNSTAYERFYGKNPDWVNNLRTFGEIAMVHDGKLGNVKGKIKNRGIPCMFIGYPVNHSPDIYEFLNLETHKKILSRSVIWLYKSYGEYNNLKINITKL
jgi:hypothetical protein